MNVKFPHKFSKQEAIERVKYILAEAKPKLGDKGEITEERWEGDTLHFAFNAQGQHISGQLYVREHEYEINAKLPLLMRIFEGRLEKMIMDQASQMLGK
jgi:hypothetical protein